MEEMELMAKMARMAKMVRMALPVKMAATALQVQLVVQELKAHPDRRELAAAACLAPQDLRAIWDSLLIGAHQKITVTVMMTVIAMAVLEVVNVVMATFHPLTLVLNLALHLVDVLVPQAQAAPQERLEPKVLKVRMASMVRMV